jgi:hypothetical protein
VSSGAGNVPNVLVFGSPTTNAFLLATSVKSAVVSGEPTIILSRILTDLPKSKINQGPRKGPFSLDSPWLTCYHLNIVKNDPIICLMRIGFDSKTKLSKMLS